MHNVLWILSATVFLLSFQTISADKVHLKNGTVIQGRIVQQDANTIEIQTATGKQKVAKVLIRRIEYVTDAKAVEEKKKAEELAKEQAEAEKKVKEEADKKKRDEEEKAQIENERLKNEVAQLREEKKKRDDAALELKQKSGWPAIWRSLVFPGWGQVYRGDKLTGRLFMGGTAVAMVYAYDANNKYNKARSEYQDASRNALLFGLTANPAVVVSGYINANDKRNAMLARASRANIATGFLGAIYLTNVVDVILFRGGSGNAQSFNFSPTNQLSFGYSIRF